MKQAIEIIEMAREAFMAGADLRRRRVKYKDFTYGRQWGEIVNDPDGHAVTEGDLARQSGRQPLTHNLTRQLVKSVIGRWRHELKGEGERRVDRKTIDLNSLDELDSRGLEEFLISGCVIQRIVQERRLGGEGVWVDNVSPARFFVNRHSDPRGSDIELVGMLHDMSLKEVMMRWGGGSREKMAEIERIYRREWNAGSDVTVGTADEPDFYSAGAGRCRVIEVWTLEGRETLQCHDAEKGSIFMASSTAAARRNLTAVNRRRATAGRPAIDVETRITLRWHCRMLTPGGAVLTEFDSPWKHCSHPFAIKMYPMTDGEVHSLVEDVIDQQRYINRLVTLVDHVMSFSAKGVLMFPVEALPDTFSWDDVRSQWSRPDGIVPYVGTFGTRPEQVVGNGGNAGASDLLALEMKMMEQVSGVSNALQGRLPQSITSADALRSSIENATVALLDLFECFRSFRHARDEKIADT